MHRLLRSAPTVGLVVAMALATTPTASLASPPSVPRSLRLGGAQGSVVVQTAPFRLTFLDAEGRRVLRQVENTSPPPFVGSSTIQPGGTTSLTDNVLYSPFTFEVGGASNVQFPAAPWVGAILSAGDAGVQYSATDVVAYQKEPGGLGLTVATNDPTGRELEVRLSTRPDGAIGVSMSVTPDAGVVAVADSFQTDRTERFHGFGGRHTRVDQRGRTLTGWLQAQNLSAGQLQPAADAVPGTEQDAYLFPNGPSAAYYVQNSFISSSGYGFVLDRPELSRWRMASDRYDAWQVDLAASGMDYTVAPGGVRHAVSVVSDMNGRHRMPPRWSQGTVLYRGVKVLSADADTPQSYEAKVREDLARIDRHQLDVSAYGIEGWAILDRQVLADLVEELHRRGIKVLFYLRCFVSADPANTEPPELFIDAVDKGYVATNEAGLPYLFGSTFVAGAAALIDFTNPAARRWWGTRVREVLDVGADGFMQDFGEQAMVDMHFFDGSTGATMHNDYPTIYHRTTRAVVARYERRHPGRKIFFFTRAGFSGTPGSAAHESANFPGDETTDWTLSSGLPSIVPDMLNRAVGGAWGYTTDIGGYFDYTSPPVSEELFTRWHQASALMPYFRVHNSSSTGVKMPWDFGTRALRRFRASAALHGAALSYLRRLERRATITGIPPTRPLWLAFPHRPELARVADEWMLGNHVLVAPVLTEGARSRQVALPPGCWRYVPTGVAFKGGTSVEVPAGLSTLPYFFSCGTRPFAEPRGGTR